MIWQEIRITTNSSAVDAVANLFHELGFGGVVIEEPLPVFAGSENPGWEGFGLSTEVIPDDKVVVKGYLPLDQEENSGLSSPALIAFRQKLNQLWKHFGLAAGLVSLSEVNDEDWANAWKQYYHPVKVADSIVVKPTWEEYTPKKGEVILELDPGMAFGTGTHPTTLHCLRALERYLRPGQSVVDVGTGSGILAIAAAKLGAEKVTAIDLDPKAITIARENVVLNRLNDRIELRQGDLLEPIMYPETFQVDLIVGNLVASIVQKLGDSAWRKLKPEGMFICAGIIQGRLTEVLEGLNAIGFRLVEITDEGDWSTLVLSKPA